MIKQWMAAGTLALMIATPACAAKLGKKNSVTVKDAVEVPYNEDMSTAFNGIYAVNVGDSNFQVYNVTTSQLEIETNNLTAFVFCAAGNPLPSPNFCNGAQASYDFDPRVKFDWNGHRWIITSGVYDQQALWFAASVTDDPTGPWYVYEIDNTCGWDQPALGLTRQYATIIEDDCNGNGPSQSNTFRVNLADAENGTLNWFYTTDGITNYSQLVDTYWHPVSDSGPTLPNDDSQYTVRAESETIKGVTYPGVSIGQYEDTPNSMNPDWKDVYIKEASAAGNPLPNYFDAPGAPQGLHIWPITLETGVMSAWKGNESLIFAGEAVESADQKYTVALFAVPAATSGGTAHTLSFTPAAEVMAVTMHPCMEQGKVVVGAIETSSTVYPRLSEYTWNLNNNTIAGPTVVKAGNVTPNILENPAAVYQATRWMELLDGSDCVNGVADVEGQLADDTYQDMVDYFPNPNAQTLGFVQLP